MIMKQTVSHLKKSALIRILGIVGVFVVLIGASPISSKPSSFPALAGKAGTWTTYMGGNAHTGFNSTETILNASTASNLKLHWSYKAGGWISSQVVIANSTLYWGSADGYEHATDLNGHQLWQSFLGKVAPSPTGCFPTTNGVAGTATVSTIPIKGLMTSVVFVGGGDTQFYALNATNGAILWHTSLGTPPNMMIWGGSSVYHGSVYVGRSSYGDCPLVAGELFQLNVSTGAIQHSFMTVAPQCVGGGIWMTPTIDQASNTVYVSTGTIHTCPTYESNAYALVELSTTTLTLIHSWQVPKSQQGSDDDFGSTPTLFMTKINGVVHRMIGLVNKNGIYYALDRADISAGPLWETLLSTPIPGSRSSISSSAWDGKTLYEGDSHTVIAGQDCQGSIRALNPATGAILWAHCLPGKVQGSAMVVPGIVAVGTGAFLNVLNASTGVQLFSYHDPSPTSLFWGTPTISNGILYIGNRDGTLFAFGL